MSDTDWPEGADDFVQAIADTKLLLGHRYAQWTLAGQTLEDDIGGAASAQEEIGHVRQLFRALMDHGRDRSWLEGNREPDEFANAAALDTNPDAWPAFLATAGPVDRAAWFLLDAIDHPDLDGLITKIGEDEYFHLEFHDARLEILAEDDPSTIESRLDEVIPATLAFLGPAGYDSDADPLYRTGFTDRPVSELRDAFRSHYEDVLAGTPVSLENVAWSEPDMDSWDPVRRRVEGGGITDEDLRQLRGEKNQVFALG